MTGKRSYDDPCGVARALNLIGERWALLVVRELLHGPKRFRDLARALDGMSENVLSARLRELQDAGIVHRYTLGPPASTRVYGLTGRGADLEPVLLALAAWGSRTPTTSTRELSPDALVLALKTTFAPDRAGDLTAHLELRVDQDTFTAHVAGGELHIGRGAPPRPDVVLCADSATLRALVFTGLPLQQALTEGCATLDGDARVAACFLDCFPRPTASTPTSSNPLLDVLSPVAGGDP